jgi:hypothetical protein
MGSYVVDLLFDLVPAGGPQKDFFPFFDGTERWDGKMSLDHYIYGYCGHVSTMMRIYAATMTPDPRLLTGLFWLEFIDLICYALNYNYTLFTVFGYGIEYNHFQFFGAFILLKVYGKSE